MTHIFLSFSTSFNNIDAAIEFVQHYQSLYLDSDVNK